MKALLSRAPGGPDTLSLEDLPDPVAGRGQVTVAVRACAINYPDVLIIEDRYQFKPQRPFAPGGEIAGVVETVGEGVSGFAPGDRVGYVTGAYGAYASHRVLPAALALRLPDWMGERLAASVLLKGLTAEMLLRQVHRVEAGQTILVHAAAGGVGRLLCQWAAHLGATVIGTAGSAAKAEAARAAGCAHVVLYREQDFVAEVKRITGGFGVDAAYDSVGKDTFDGSLECLAPRGHLVNFGQASGPVPPFQVQRLAARSNSLTRPILFHYLAGRPALEAMAEALFAVLRSGAVRAEPGAALPLAEASRAHHLLESRQAEAPLVLLPQEGC